MIDFIALFVMIISIGFTIYQFNFIRKKRKEIQRYPYFQLRDEIIMSIYEEKDPHKFNSVYELVNFSINNLKHYKYNTYSKAIDRYLNTFFDNFVRNNFIIVDKNNDYEKLSPQEKKIGELLINTAKENSFLLRLATTKLGFNIMFTYKFIPRLIRTILKHIDSDKFRPQFETVRKVSYLNRIFAT